MKKRIVCVLLTLIMLVSLIPAAAISASAATNAIGEAAISILKTWEKYDSTCDENGYIGYGTKCTKDGEHGDHFMFEKDADAALRKFLKELDTAVNNFADKNGLSLTQSQHDALVLFTFENGTAWTTGTGDFQTAIKSRSTGATFLNAICLWNKYDNDTRRLVEANMYLNGAYSSTVPSRFICVTFDAGEDGTMDENGVQYFDVATPVTITLKPTPVAEKVTFLGWYTDEGERVDTLTSSDNGLTLTAKYQDDESEDYGTEASYTIKKSALASTSVYFEPNGEKTTKYVNAVEKEVTITLADELNVVADYMDSKGVHWAKIVDDDDCFIGWVKVKAGSSSAVTDTTLAMDVNVTVTNSYVNMRKNASITSTKNGSFNQGDVLRIIDVKNGSDGFLWGQVAKSADDATAIGWVALMYTNYDSVKSGSGSTASTNNSTVVATATITYPGYVNLRSDAGTNNQIVGALAVNTTVDLYETKYVNGIQWGRCSTGWFCLSYAKVTRLVEESSNISDAGFANYVFSGVLSEDYADEEGKIYASAIFVTAPGGETAVVDEKDKDGNAVALKSANVTITNLMNVDEAVWGKTSYGWIELFDESGAANDSAITLDPAKFYVTADTLTVRAEPANGADRVDVLIKGVEITVSQIYVDNIGNTIWGHADKIGEDVPTYDGWVNLANKNVSRTGAPSVSGSTGSSSGSASGTVMTATVINTDSVRVRKTGATYGAVLGSLSRGSTYNVLEENDGWYNLDVDVDGDPETGSWVSGQYLDIQEVTTSTGSTSTGSSNASSGTVETGMGIVANTYTGVNIRTGAGTGNAAIGKYLTGTTVEILEVTTHGASKWGRTDKGWVCMDYIVMVSNYVPSGSTSSSTGTSTGSSSTGSTTSTAVAIYTGYVNEETVVYKSTSTGSEVVRTLDAGDPVTVHELLTNVEYEDKKIGEKDTDEGYIIQTEKKTTYWARVNDGYIVAPGYEDAITLYALDDETYTANEKVEVRNGDDITLAKGDKVTVTRVWIEKNEFWGYIECDKGEGEVCLSKLTKGAVTFTEQTNTNTNTGSTGTATTTPVLGSTGNTSTGGYVTNTSGYKYTGKVINTNEVNVRATASTNATITTTLKSGAALVVYETTISENMAWGRCDAGWVYLYYVDLTPCVNGAVDARVVYNDNTIIYTDMNCSGVAGSYSRMSVIDIYEIVGKMARTELGWVNTDNLL